MKKIFPFFLFLIIILVDQLSKWWASEAGLVSLNTGVSFGWLAQGQLVLVSLVLVFLLLFSFLSVKYQLPKSPSLTILAAGTSNLADRILYGGVRDWLPLPMIEIKNNLADWFIFFSLVFLVINLQKSENED